MLKDTIRSIWPWCSLTNRSFVCFIILSDFIKNTFTATYYSVENSDYKIDEDTKTKNESKI